MRRLAGRRMLRRSAQLLIGLFFCGIGVAFLIRSALGAAPWDVLTQGMTRHLPLTFGATTIVTGVVVLLLWIPLRQKPGVGTVLNALLVGPAADLGFLVIPVTDHLALQIAYFVVGLLLLSAATGLYIGASLGPGPRDGLMTGLHQRTGFPIWIVRTVIEVVVVVAGWALGGNVGLGTAAFALLIGPLCQFFLRRFTVRLPVRSRAENVGTDTGRIATVS